MSSAWLIGGNVIQFVLALRAKPDVLKNYEEICSIRTEGCTARTANTIDRVDLARRFRRHIIQIEITIIAIAYEGVKQEALIAVPMIGRQQRIFCISILNRTTKLQVAILPTPFGLRRAWLTHGQTVLTRLPRRNQWREQTRKTSRHSPISVIRVKAVLYDWCSLNVRRRCRPPYRLLLYSRSRIVFPRG